MTDRPMIFDGGGGGDGDGASGAHRAERPDEGPSRPDPGHAVVGSSLALRLPDWDLVPPTEFVRRHPPR
jgi:hypothetical protein